MRGFVAIFVDSIEDKGGSFRFPVAPNTSLRYLPRPLSEVAMRFFAPVPRVVWAASLVLFAITAFSSPPADAAWPPKPGADFSDPANWPNDGGYARCKKGKDGKCLPFTCENFLATKDAKKLADCKAKYDKLTEKDGKTRYIVDGGDWNLWSWTPISYAMTDGFRQPEFKAGAGMHADTAWTKTVGDRRVRIAVLDSGIKWDHDDLVNKHYLNKKELPEPEKACRTKDFKASDPYDTNGDGIFNMLDWTKENGNARPKTPCDSRVKDVNKNGLIDPGDLIRTFSDGKDDDGNGYVDDISGWDFFRDDNNPYDETRFGHGTGEARDSASEGNNGRGSIGVCPECTIINVRVADSFVCDVNDFAASVVFAVDSGAHVIQEALGSINNTPYAMNAIEYAYSNNVAVIASAADELSFHHNFPGTNNHTIYVHAIVYNGNSPKTSTTFLNFNNCTNYGGQLVLSTPGTGCSSEAVGMSSGHAGLMYSAALQAKLNPPISAEEMRGVLLKSADDINVPESKTDKTKFPSVAGWDLHFGYGRNNVFKSVSMILDDEIPPEIDIVEPGWFQPIEITQSPKIAIKGRIGKRPDGKSPRYNKYEWKLEYAKGVDPKSGWKELKKGSTAGMEGTIFEMDAAAIAKELFNYTAPLLHHDQYTVTLRLTATAKNKAGKTVEGEFRKTIGLYQEPDLLPGYPKRIGTSIEASPKLFDIDCDGKDEIVQPTTDGAIHVWKGDGTEAEGWPQYAPVRLEFRDDYHFNVLKACAYRKDKKDCVAKQGTLPGKYRETIIINSPAVGDLDGDGKVEVVVATYDGSLLAWHADGKAVTGFPVRTDPKNVIDDSVKNVLSSKTSPDHVLDDGICSSPVLADLDGDGKLEIVVSAMDQHLYVFRHDGSQQKGFPVLVSDPALKGKLRARIVATPAVGDVDGDGKLDIAVGTNEVLGAAGVKNEARGYLIHGDGNEHAGGPFHKGWPIKVYGLMADVLPLVGRGVPGNPVMVDIDLDGKLEINFDSIGSAGLFFKHDGEPHKWKIPGKNKLADKLDNINFGKGSNTEDSPAYILIATGSLGKIDRTGGVDFVKATAGFNFALTFASGGERADFDHHLSAWDTLTGKMVEGWPRVIEDWQFFSNPAIVDINGDDDAEVIAGSAGYLLHAWNYLGKEPEGFPKYTNGWILASPGLGDIDGDGNWDVAVGTRNGYMFAWKTKGPKEGSVNEWTWYGHDLHNTNNYHADTDPYTGDRAVCAKKDDDKEPEDDSCAAHPVSNGPGPMGWLLGLALLAVVAIRRRSVA